MNTIIFLVWLLNLIGSLIFTIRVLRPKHLQWVGTFLVIVPVFGFLLYYICVLTLQLSKGHTYDRESLVKRYEMERMEKAPILEKELNLIPVEDAMAISSNQEKRALLLDQLKQDMHQNYRYILPAGADKDSESAHYVAAGKMEVDRKKRLALRALKETAQTHPQDWKAQHDYLAGLVEYMDSGLITTKEALSYEGEYCRLFEQAEASGQMSGTETASYLSFLIHRGNAERAEAYWHACPEEQKNEDGYRRMLQLYYDQTEKEKFYTCLNELKRSDIVLSPEGLRILRFWDARGN